MANNGETMETVTDFIFLDSKITVDCDWSHEITRHLLLGRKSVTNLDSILKKQRHYFVNKRPSSQSYVFSSCHVQMWELDHKESWTPKNWCFWTVVLEKTLEHIHIFIYWLFSSSTWVGSTLGAYKQRERFGLLLLLKLKVRELENWPQITQKHSQSLNPNLGT